MCPVYVSLSVADIHALKACVQGSMIIRSVYIIACKSIMEYPRNHVAAMAASGKLSYARLQNLRQFLKQVNLR